MIRLATIDDLNMVLEWRNSPAVIKDSTLQREVTLEEHSQWFEATVPGITRLLWIVYTPPDQSEREWAAGTVRIDNHNWYGVVSIYLLPEFQGKGLGGKSLTEACKQALDHWPDMRELWAYIRRENLVSQFAFGAVGFRESATIGCPPGHLVMVKVRG